MSATINTGWLKGKNGVKFAPKTLSSQVITNDGIALEEKIAADLNEIRTYIDETVSGNEGGGPHDHNDTYYTESEIDSMLSTTASTIKNDLLNGAGEAYDTLRELGELIDENTDAIEALELIATNKMDKNNPAGTGTFSLNREGDIGENSVAIGNNVTASGQYSYAEGTNTTASGKASHAEGIQTTAASEAQHVQGRYNIIDEEGVYLHIVGNGITDKTIGKQRSNAHTLDWDGNAWYQGEVRVGGSSYEDASTLTTSKYVDDKFSITAGEKVVGKTFAVYNSNIGRDETITAEEGAEIFNDYSRNIATGMCSHAEGRSTVATGMYSHAEGEQSKSSGYASHAEGSSTASNQYSHGEGDGTIASGYASHTEGYKTTASGNRSHAEGSETEAFGFISHAEGRLTKALGEHSHAEGYGTDASGNAQHAQGKYNIIDTENKYAHIVGNGESNYARSNAHTLDWQGNAEYAGDVIAHGCGGENPISLIELANKINSGSTGNTGGTSSFNGTASDVSYDDQQTQLGVNNVQDAIGELAELFKSLSLSYSNNILYLSLNGVVISSCTIVPTVVGSISLDNIISIDNLQSGVYTLKYENDESILDGVENICELEVF